MILKILLIFSVIQIVKNDELCQLDQDCEILHFCNQEKICEHKDLFPLTQREIIGTIVIGLIIGISNGGGIGGGPIVVPALQVIFKYELKEAIYIGFISILAGALGNYFKFSFLRNDQNGGPLINYDLILINVPVLAFGSIIGLIINQILPELFVCIILVIVLILSLKKSIKRFIIQRRKEIEQKNQMFNQKYEEIDSLKDKQNQRIYTIDQKEGQELDQQENQRQEIDQTEIDNDQNDTTSHLDNSNNFVQLQLLGLYKKIKYIFYQSNLNYYKI